MAARALEDITAAEPEEEPPPVSVEELRDMIRKHALLGPKGRPTELEKLDDEALEELAAIVNYRARQVREARAEAQWNEDCRTASAAIEALRSVLPRMERKLQTDAEKEARLIQPIPFAEDSLACVRVLGHAAMAFAERVPALSLWRAAGVRDMPVPNWRHFAPSLFADLERMFGQRLGRHDTGPAARLLAALVARITGEAISPARVGEALRNL